MPIYISGETVSLQDLEAALEKAEEDHKEMEGLTLFKSRLLIGNERDARDLVKALEETIQKSLQSAQDLQQVNNCFKCTKGHVGVERY